jgi:hypothetical protein
MKFLCAISFVFSGTLATAQECKIDELIQDKLISVGNGKIEFSEPQQLARKFDIRTNVKVDREKGGFFYSVRISNGYEYKGFTTCACATLQSGSFELFTLGGTWGISEAAGVKGSRIRNEALVQEIDQGILKWVDGVRVRSGWCPSNRIAVELGEAAKKAALDAALGYVAGL